MNIPIRVLVKGHLNAEWSNWFGIKSVYQREDGTTELVGVIRDQAELHGLLDRIGDLGVPLLSLSTGNPPPVGDRAEEERDDSTGHTTDGG
jgi:hypothetical protein